jgi:hypothetical protein
MSEDEGVWESNGGFKIHLPNGTSVPVSGAVTTTLVNHEARKHFKKFKVKDADGRYLEPNDFPYSGDVWIESFNEAK